MTAPGVGARIRRWPFLDYRLPAYDNQQNGWKREERRLHGGDPVLVELLKWKAEADDYYAARLAQASYVNFPKLHASTLTGHLSQNTPVPNYGRLGEVRERNEIDVSTLAELLHYNVDGIGQDGSELLAWFDAVQERAITTGYRWVLVEMPTIETLAQIRGTRGRPPEGEVTVEDALQGFRPYAVEYSPLLVPFWQFVNGRLDFAVVRIPVARDRLVDAGGVVQPEQQGYYLLVRQGYEGLGDEWSAGGWWKFDRDQQVIATGDWSRTAGTIPMFLFVGEPAPGITDYPTIGRSLTMELGQMAVALMNRISERNWNITYAAKSVSYILGIDPDRHAAVVDQHEAGGIVIGVPPVTYADGKVGIPQMWNSSAAALDSQVFKNAIDSAIGEAREIMVRQVTSTPDSSGRSKEAGFAEATSPLLARLATTRQQAINNFLYFASLRFGVENPEACVVIPREFDLAPVVDDIDKMLDTLKKTMVRSPTWEAELLVKAGDERGLLPEDPAKRKVIEEELASSAVGVPAPGEAGAFGADRAAQAFAAIRGGRRPPAGGGNGRQAAGGGGATEE